jgi:TonB-linked SusC/RagA family outer membrane protein
MNDRMLRPFIFFASTAKPLPLRRHDAQRTSAALAAASPSLHPNEQQGTPAAYFLFSIFIYLFKQVIMKQKLLDQSRTGQMASAPVQTTGGAAAARRAKRLLLLLMLCAALPRLVSAQDINISGTVLDGNREPLAGVSVVVKGSTRGVTTGAGGDYSIQAAADATLVFSFMGMAPREEPVNGRGRIDVTLSEDDKALEEVVVIGYGTQRREAVTGSVVSMDGGKLSEIASGNITQALQGRMAGVEMSQTSSKPGAAMQIRIRGTRSLTASNDPLVVLDGIPFAGSIGDINPNDIKSLDILKDASATAIYGSRGANGVIMVTTFRGSMGAAKPQVSYSGYYGVKNAIKYPMMDGPELLALRKVANIYTNTLDEADDVNTDWQDLLYRTGVTTSHDVSVTGSSAIGAYNFGVGYYKDEAVLPQQYYNRISMRATIDQEIKIFRFGLSSNSNYSLLNGNNLGTFGTLRSSPLANPYNEDGSLKRVVEMPLTPQWVYTEESIEALGDKWIDQTKSFGSYNTLYGEVKISGIEGLKYRVNLGLNFRMTNGGAYTGEGVFSDNPTNPSSASVSNSLTTNWAVENLLTYDRTFAGKHQVNVVGLYSAEQTFYNRSRMAARDVPNDAFQFYNLGYADGEKTIAPGDQQYQLSGLISWMGRAMYSYDNRYMLSVTLRSDASSRLAPKHQWHTYPAVSAGWNIKEESFMQSLSVIDRLKLRAGYGQTSNQAVAPYATLGLLSTRPYNFGADGYATGYYVSQLPNENLGWEYSETWNFGVDFSLLKNRLSGTLEYYVQDTKDVLLSVGLPRTSGVSSYTANIGQTQNKGFEISLNGVILDNLNGWTWEVGVNLYTNQNKLVALASGQEKDEYNRWFVGHPINAIYDYEKIGLWQEGDAYKDILEPAAAADVWGFIKVKYDGDYNPDGSPVRAIGPDDRQIMDADPDFQGGFNTRVAYKGFDLNVIGAFKSGGILISTLHHSPSGYLNHLSGRYGNVKADYWTPENTGAKYPNPAPGTPRSGDYPKYGNTLGYFDASYLKIRAITLGYSLETKWIKYIGVDRMRIYATVQNPFVMFSPFNDETGMDPETNSYGDENLAVPNEHFRQRTLIIGTNTPSTRNYLFGINLSF